MFYFCLISKKNHLFAFQYQVKIKLKTFPHQMKKSRNHCLVPHFVPLLAVAWCLLPEILLKNVKSMIIYTY